MLAALTSTAQAQTSYGYHPQYGHAPTAYAQQMAAENATPVYSEDAEGCDGCGTCDSCCDDGCGGGLADMLGCWQWRPRGLFAEVEYNMWWTKARSVPVLATTSPLGTPLIDVGVLPSAISLYGGDVGEGLGDGGRVTFGKWLDSYHTTALAARFTAFRADDGDFTAISDGTTNLAIPFIDAQSGLESSYIIGYTPDGVTAISQGSINIQDRLDLTGVEVFGNFLLMDERGARLDLFGGYHMLRLDNSLSIGSSLTAFGDNITTTDIFDTENEFHGGFGGLMATFAHNRWFFNISGKLSIGNMNQRVQIDGLTVATSGGVVDIRDEGLFALGTNQGSYSRDRVVYIPEANLKLGYRVRDNIAVTLGYNFLYISNVAMSGDQVDRTLNLSQTNGGPLIGPSRPILPEIRDTDFWAQGLNFGLEVAF